MRIVERTHIAIKTRLDRNYHKTIIVAKEILTNNLKRLSARLSERCLAFVIHVDFRLRGAAFRGAHKCVSEALVHCLE